MTKTTHILGFFVLGAKATAEKTKLVVYVVSHNVPSSSGDFFAMFRHAQWKRLVPTLHCDVPCYFSSGSPWFPEVPSTSRSRSCENRSERMLQTSTQIHSGFIKHGWLENPPQNGGFVASWWRSMIFMVHFPARHVWLPDGTFIQLMPHTHGPAQSVWCWVFKHVAAGYWLTWDQEVKHSVTLYNKTTSDPQ